MTPTLAFALGWRVCRPHRWQVARWMVGALLVYAVLTTFAALLLPR